MSTIKPLKNSDRMISDTTEMAKLSNVFFSYDSGSTWILNNLNLTVSRGERICLVGPNGSGKSTLAKILAGLIAPDQGRVNLLNHQVFDAQSAQAQQYRQARRGIGMVFQNPEDQIVTTVVENDVAFGPENLAVPPEAIGSRITTSLRSVGMADHRKADPIHLSGGQQQRVTIAGMLAMTPGMLVLDEPTAMLDASSQAAVMNILDSLQDQGTTIIHVTHRPEETSRADRVLTIRRGQLVEAERTAARHPPSPSITATGHADRAAASDSTPLSATGQEESTTEANECVQSGDSQPAIVVSHVSMRYGKHGPLVLDDLSLLVKRGETVAIMGKNGSGKSTLTRLLCGLAKPESGSISVEGIPVNKPTKSDLRRLRRHIGLVMQAPEHQLFAATVAQDVAYGPKNQGLTGVQVTQRVDEALTTLHIAHLAERSPFKLSGGQQRLAAVAGIISCKPDILILDEPTAGLDTAAKERIYELIGSLKTQGLTVLLITHSQYEAERLADRTITLPSRAEFPTCADQTVETNPPEAEHNHHSWKRCPSEPRKQPKPEPTGQNADCSYKWLGQDSQVLASPTVGQEAMEPVERSFKSPVSRLDPRVKSVAVLILMFAFFAVSNLYQLAVTSILVFGIGLVATINPFRLLSSLRVVLIPFVAIGLLNIIFVQSGTVLLHFSFITITSQGVEVAVLYVCRLALVIILGAVLLNTTTMIELADAFGSLLSPLKAFGLHTQELALVLSLALRFLPTLASETQSIRDAQAARGGSIETGSPVKRVSALAAIIVPVLAGALRHANNLSLALEARCYEEGIHRTHWRRMLVRSVDWAFLSLPVFYIAVIMALALVA